MECSRWVVLKEFSEPYRNVYARAVCTEAIGTTHWA